MASALRTKKDYQQLLLSLLGPLKSRFSDGCARIRLYGGGVTYDRDAIEMEAFARPLWGLVPYWMGGGRDSGFEDIYPRGLAAGTDPDNPEYWGNTSDFDQRFVEMAPIAFGLFAVPGILWEPLGSSAKDNLASWLYTINNHEMSRCNWYYFRILVNLALRKLGKPYSEERLSSDLAFIESCYLDDGWYKDGQSERTDYYSAFAMQFYGLICAWMLEDEDEAYAERMRKRASAFCSSFILWFDAEGRALPYGRSLIYRMAQSSFWSACALFHIDAFTPSTLKGLIGRNIRYWMDQDIADADGILSVGYCYPNLTMAERYNAPGSPYWCCKVFALLALPEDDPFWQAEEIPYPAESLGVHRIEPARMLIQHRGWDVSAYVPGMLGMRSLGHFTEKYDKFVYSTAFPFSVSHTTETFMEAAPDNMLSFEIAGNLYVRRGSIEYSVGQDSMFSHWSPCPGVDVRTTITLADDGHIREHEIESSIGFIAYDAGYSIPADGCLETIEGEAVSLSCGSYVSGAESLSGNGSPVSYKADPNTSLAARNTTIPCIRYELGPGRYRISDRFRTGKAGI